MNTTEKVLQWIGPIVQVAGIILLLRWPRLTARGLLLASIVLSLCSSLGWKLVTLFLEGGGIDPSRGNNRTILDAWAFMSRSLYLKSEALFLGFLGSIAFRRHHSPQEMLVGQNPVTALDPLVCPKCQEPNTPGTIRCQKCKRTLQPTLFAIITALAILANLGAIALAFFIAPNWANVLLKWKWDVSPITYYAVLFLVGGIVVAPSALTIGVILAARRGWNWASVFLQWFFGLNVIPVGLLAFQRGGISYAFLAATLVIAGLLIFYFGTARVREFCSVGRVEVLHEAHQ